MNIKNAVFTVVNLLFMNKRKNLSEKLDIKEYILLENQIEFITSTGTTIICKDGIDTLYFRECREHLRLKVCVRNSIEEYFTLNCINPQSEEWKNCILEDLKDDENFYRLLKIEDVYQSNFARMRDGTFCDYGIVGIPTLERMNFQKELVQFLKFIRGEIHNNLMNSYQKKGYLDNFNANRQMATRILADMLGLSNIIPEVSIAKITVLNKFTKVGTLMKQGGTQTPLRMSIEERSNIDKASFIKSISNLDFFDSICYQLDHRMGNYNIVKNDRGLIVGVSAFDNDAYLTFATIPCLPKKTYCGCSSVINSNGFVNRPYMDFELSQKLNELSYQSLKDKLGEYLTFAQLLCLWTRIRILRNAVKRTVQSNPGFLIYRDAWNDVSTIDELEGNFGYTYYRYYTQVDESKVFLKKITDQVKTSKS